VREGTARAARLAWALCGLIVIADQATKALVQANLVPGQRLSVLGPLSITLAHNRGIAFGLAGGAGVALVAVTALALCVVGALFWQNPTRPGMWVGVGLLCGGALGNLADRVRAGVVTDFIEVPHWPPFNLADTAITVGVILVAIGYLRQDSVR
jgi:signal peptidase II